MASEQQSIIEVRVVPRASRSEIVDLVDGVLKVRLTSPPVDGAANEELVKLLAKRLGIAKSYIEIISGSASRNKRVRVDGVSLDQMTDLMKPS